MGFFHTTFALVGCTMLAAVDVGRCYVALDPVAINYEIAKGVLADDVHWKQIIDLKVTVNTHGENSHVTDMLSELGFADDQQLRAQPILRYLVTNPGWTRNQLFFGIKVLATAMSCQFTNTVLVHLFFISAYGFRTEVTIPPIRSYLSHVQIMLTKYMDKLAMFNISINFYLNLINRINVLFDKHNTNNNITKAEFMSSLKEIAKFIKNMLAAQCGVTEEWKIVKTVNVDKFNANIFTKSYNKVDVHQLISMIQGMDEYEYISLSSLGIEFWMERLKIEKYVLAVNNTFIEIDDDNSY